MNFLQSLSIDFCGSSLFINSKLMWKVFFAQKFPVSIFTFRVSASSGDLQSCKSKLESLFCYDKSIPEEKIEKPIGLSLSTKEIGDKSPCMDCESKGAVLCTTCSGSGLYVDSILECQGIIVKVRCLGCGGSGNTMCSTCGGRGHL
ncbi:unnamed protein product [Spirodela intermedia]|uniref:Uncharacterized protein n=2 Tax=Spirodela intermedia TaxID=51605 RepID=A0A7I8I815_SPIIN|nr:unnamed protein product [Spirodela intermedia]CAA6653786.1 unnamed protein product [Spirodela intermedia]CAA7388164.1 unnamed protein product [Spirodela intermedia]